MMKLILVLLLVVAAAAAAQQEVQASNKQKPHILLVLVDDWGWGNIGHHSGTAHHKATTKEEVQTPNIDRLVKEGITLDRHYTYNYCNPSRSSLQTGRLPVHVVVTNEEPTTQNKDDPVSGYAGAPTKMTGIATKLKSVGYKTHMTGKWDVGMAHIDQTPMRRGYDSYFGYFHHANDYWDETLGATSTGTTDICYGKGEKIVDLWDNDGPARNRNSTVYEEVLFKESSLKVIKEHDPKDPLFLFHSFHLCHSPLQVPKENFEKFKFLKNYNRITYAAMVNYMDTVVGELVDAFKAKGMWNNTLMILSSDNGGPIYATGVNHLAGSANNIPLRGGKLSDFEGGIRVNAFLSGGFIPQSKRGTVYDNYIHVCDWYSTICNIVGVDPTDKLAEKYNLPPIDSVNQWPALMGETNQAPRDEMHISTSTVIQGNYKLMTGWDVSIYLPSFLRNLSLHDDFMPFNGYWAGWEPLAPVKTATHFKICNPACLYDIRNDPYEQHDIFHQNKTLGKQLLARLAELNKSYFNPNRGTENPESCDIFMNKYGGFYGPFVFDDVDGDRSSMIVSESSLQ